MDVKSPRRILFLGARDAGILDVVKDLTGSAPLPVDDTGSIAGLAHAWDVRTTYYSASVPIWIDEVSDAHAWKTEFLRPEAKEVVDAVGAWIFCFRSTENEAVNEEVLNALKNVHEVVDHHGEGYTAETVMLAVAFPTTKTTSTKGESVNSRDEDEVKCMEFGFEFIDYAATGMNEYGEKVGMQRLREALETAEWGGGDENDALGLDGIDFDAEDDMGGLDLDEAEMTAEIFGVKAALSGDDGLDSETEKAMPPADQAAQVEGLDRLMAKLLAVKEQSANLPEAQRKSVAAKAVRELLQNEQGL